MSIIKIKNGKSNTVEANNFGRFAFFDRSKIIKNSDKYLFNGEYIIVPGEGEFEPKYFKGKFDLHQRAYAITTNNINKLLNKYLFYFLIKYSKKFKENSVGSTVSSLRISSFNWINDSVFPLLQVQQHIIDIIEPFEKLKEQLKDQKDKIEKFLKMIYQRFSSKEEIFLKELVTISTKKYNSQKYYVDTSSIGSLTFKGKEIISTLKSRANLTPAISSFIISKMIGENKIFPIYDSYFTDFVYSTGFLNIVPLKFEEYILGYLLSNEFIKNKANLATGTLMASLTNDAFNNLKINKPLSENITKTNLILLLNKIEIIIIKTNNIITNLINKLVK